MLMSKLSIYLVYTPFKRALIVIVISLLFFLISLIIWVPLLIEKESFQSDMVVVDTEINEFVSKISIAKTLKVSRNTLSDINNRIERNISQAKLISELNRVVAKTGVELTDQTFREVSIYDGVKVYKQSLGINGSYKDIRYFLSQLSTHMPGLNIVGKITIINGDDGAVSTQIDLNTYSAHKI